MLTQYSYPTYILDWYGCTAENAVKQPWLTIALLRCETRATTRDVFKWLPSPIIPDCPDIKLCQNVVRIYSLQKQNYTSLPYTCKRSFCHTRWMSYNHVIDVSNCQEYNENKSSLVPVKPRCIVTLPCVVSVTHCLYNVHTIVWCFRYEAQVVPFWFEMTSEVIITSDNKFYYLLSQTHYSPTIQSIVNVRR